MERFSKASINNNKNETKNNFFGGFGNPEYNVGFIPHKSGTWRIEIDDEIENVGQFSTAIQALEAAKPEDQVEIHLQCCGGSVNATDAFIHALRKCEAEIHIVATGGCHSAATWILLEAHSFELSDNFTALVHCGASGAYGNQNEYRAKSAFDLANTEKMFKAVYQGFLTEDEITQMMGGRDFWFDAAEWVERHKKRNEYFQHKMAGQLEELEAIRAAQIALSKAAEPLPKGVAAKKPKVKKA